MTSKERLLTTMRGGIPDRVPCTPDISNMIPARLTGKPFWDIYLYQNPPLWKAYIDAARFLGIDGFLDYQVRVEFPDEIGERARSERHPWHEAIVDRADNRIVVQRYCAENGATLWEPTVTVYPRENPPTFYVSPEKIGLPQTPSHPEPLEGVVEWPTGVDLFELVYETMGDSGVLGMVCGTSAIVYDEQSLYAYYDNPAKTREQAAKILENAARRFKNILGMKIKPDYVSCGASGSLIFQSIEMFRELSLPIVQEVTRLCKESGIVSHIHSCGPEQALVRICAEESDLMVIDPLESPPMGDCNLKELKALYGDRLVLKGNLNTPDLMLRGTPEDVMHCSRQAIRDAGEGGGFILSTGDQCGRDTPYENIYSMIEAAGSYGKYA